MFCFALNLNLCTYRDHYIILACIGIEFTFWRHVVDTSSSSCRVQKSKRQKMMTRVYDQSQCFVMATILVQILITSTEFLGKVK